MIASSTKTIFTRHRMSEGTAPLSRLALDLNWREEAARHGIAMREIDRMASAFEHDDLKKALGK
jgi:hypothetical protein